MKDLFSILEPETIEALAREEPSVPQGQPAIVDCEIDGKTYRLKRSIDQEDEDRDGSRENRRTIWRLFALDGNKERRLMLLGPDCPYIPDELLYRAEQMLDWAEGGTDRRRETIRRNQPATVHDDTWA